MFKVVTIITLGYLKHKQDFYDIRSVATTVLYLIYVLLTYISIYSCKENQLDALFILSISSINLYVFRA